LRLFADIVEKGFVYRGKKPVYWSIPCRTALAEAEVEYQDHVSPSIFVKFPVVGQPETFVLIWTTTPWTLPANLAVAYNDKFQYVQVEVAGEKYILFRGLLPAVAEKCGWSNYRNTHSQLKNLPHCSSSIRSATALVSFILLTLLPVTLAPVLSTLPRATGWKTTASARKTVCRFIRRWMMMANLLTRMICRSSSRCHQRWLANPFSKSMARAMRTKRSCTSFVSTTPCCIRRIIITATHIAGVARRPSFSVRWTSGSSRLTMSWHRPPACVLMPKTQTRDLCHKPSAPPPSLKLTVSNGCRTGASTASKARCKRVPTGASHASAPGACQFQRFTTPRVNRFSTPKSFVIRRI